jgi:hypothetical protein
MLKTEQKSIINGDTPMVAFHSHWSQKQEEQIAELTEAAYHAVLERGYRGSFLELELSLWDAVRKSVERNTTQFMLAADLVA